MAYHVPWYAIFLGHLSIMAIIQLRPFSWQNMSDALEAVRERALRASGALTSARIDHVIIGGHAVAAWVSRVDKEAVRNTKDVDLLLNRKDFSEAKGALEKVGFVHQNISDLDLFLDGPEGSVRSALHVVFAGEKVRPDHFLAAPKLQESIPGPDFPVPTLEALVRMKLNAFRLKDQVHIIDLLEVGLIGPELADQLPPELGSRLQQIIETWQSEK